MRALPLVLGLDAWVLDLHLQAYQRTHHPSVFKWSLAAPVIKIEMKVQPMRLQDLNIHQTTGSQVIMSRSLKVLCEPCMLVLDSRSFCPKELAVKTWELIIHGLVSGTGQRPTVSHIAPQWPVTPSLSIAKERNIGSHTTFKSKD
jgi:hypothetical protein